MPRLRKLKAQTRRLLQVARNSKLGRGQNSRSAVKSTSYKILRKDQADRIRKQRWKQGHTKTRKEYASFGTKYM